MNIEELKALKVDKVVDARGVACPGPLLEAKRMVPSVPMHGVMDVISSDEGTTELKFFRLVRRPGLKRSHSDNREVSLGGRARVYS